MMLIKHATTLTAALTLTLLMACSQGGGSKGSTTPTPEGGTGIPAPSPSPSPQPTPSPSPSPAPEPAPAPAPTPSPAPSTGTTNPVQNICSKIDFTGVTWPASLTSAQHTYYALALNITGSFEGNVGWKNISGNFDGQGISLGLLQQNLGQGTLQPLLIEMFRRDLKTMQTNFSSTNLTSLKGMLETWLGSSVGSADVGFEELFPEGGSFNELDMDFDVVQEQAMNNSQSVSWAVQKALDGSGNVKSDWKASFQNMAVSNMYRSQQLEASTKIFTKALAYFKSLNFTELRFLLMMFDFVVQNGSIGSSHLDIYENWLDSHPGAPEEARALALLEARLTTVRPQYVADVRSRKTTIIKGTGVVHQTTRNLPKEYCYNPIVKAQ